MTIISFEGVNGAGKTTLLNRLTSVSDALLIRSPGGTSKGEEIRKQVKAALSGEVEMSGEELVHLNMRGFTLTKSEIVEPALAENSERLILLDRWYDSTHAYQGAMGVSHAYIDAMLWRANVLRPDFTILLDSPVCLAQKRHTPDASMTPQEEAYKRRVRSIYLSRAGHRSTTFVIDATQNPDNVFEQIVQILADRGVEFVQSLSD